MTNIKNLLSILLIGIIINSCNSNSKNQEEQKIIATVNTQEQGIALDTNFYKKLTGAINDEIHITMDLVKSDSIFSGSYYYDKIGKPLKLSGRLVKENNMVELIEYNEKDEETGKFTGFFDENSNFIGTWTNSKTKKSMPFSITEGANNDVAAASFKHYHNENCHTRDSLLKIKKVEDIEYNQSSCSYIDVNLITINAIDKSVSNRINETILKDVCHDIGETQFNNIDEYLASINHLTYEEIEQTDVNCSVLTNDKNVLSLNINKSSYTGGAHSNSWSMVYNFDLRTGNKIILRDFMTEENEQKLTTIAESVFAKTIGMIGWDFEPGKFPLAANYSITTGGIYFIYNAYEIGGYSMGAPDIFIPYKDIKHLIKPNSVVADIMTR